jgi:hypothetical protein
MSCAPLSRAAKGNLRAQETRTTPLASGHKFLQVNHSFRFMIVDSDPECRALFGEIKDVDVLPILRPIQPTNGAL